MFLFDYSKSRIEAILSALDAGDPIPMPPRGWNANELALLAGVSLARAIAASEQESRRANAEQANNELQEARAETTVAHVRKGVLFACDLTALLLLGRYDEQYDARVCGLVHHHASTGETQVNVQMGDKSKGN